MIDESRVKLMTKLVIYEKNEGHRAVPMSRYYKKDYVRYNVLKTWVAATVVYWSVFAAYIYMSFEDVLTKINELDYFDIMYKLLIGYAAFCVLYYLFSSMVYGYRYEKAKKGLAEYNGNLKKLIVIESGEDIEHKVLVAKDGALDEVVEPNGTVANSRIRVNRTELVRNQQELEEKKKEQQIIENVRRRNDRIAMQNETLIRQQRQAEEDKRRIRERRQQLEREQMDRLRIQQMQKMQQRQNYSYGQKSQSDEGGDR